MHSQPRPSAFRLAHFFVFLATSLLTLACQVALAAAPESNFIVLCYHNIEDTDPDQTYNGVTTAKFVAQLSWLQRNGYKFLTVDDLIAAHNGIKALPDKAALLTFDDGYESFYTRAFPILKAFNAPAVIGLVGEWMIGGSGEITPGETVSFGNSVAPRDLFMTWDQVREVVASGLVEVASHSNDLHYGIPANPQGNVEPAAVTHAFDPKSGYETDSQYRQRLNADAVANSQTIQREIGRKPRVMIWPYGEYNGLDLEIEAAHGMPITFTLTDGSANVHDISAIPRHLMADDPSLQTFVDEIHNLDKLPPMRAIQVDLDYVYDRDPAQQERNLGILVQRVHDLAINTVYLQAFADPDGSGLARQVYFPNHELPMRADLFNRAAWQLRTRDHVQVYAWLPVLAFDFADDAKLQHVTAVAPDANSTDRAKSEYQQLSPFDPIVRNRIEALYTDLAISSSFAGLLFHDDAVLSDYEDASPAALDVYASIGLPRSITAIRADPELFKRWTAFKTEKLIEFTQDLAQVVRQYRRPMHTARNIYTLPLLQPESEAWFAQNYSRFLAAYDYVVVMAMPRLESVPVSDTNQWLKSLAAIAASQPTGLTKTVFELQSVDWQKPSDQRAILSETLAGEMTLLQRLGALNLAYYPDDFLRDQPAVSIIHPAFSLQSDPYRLP